MHSLIFYLFIYLFGGVTFIPFSLIAILYFLNWYIPKYDPLPSSLANEEIKSELDEYGVTHPEINYNDLKSGELEERLSSGVETYATGWLTVTTEFYQLSQYHALKDNSESSGHHNNHDDELSVSEESGKSKSGLRYSQIYKFVKGDKNGSSKDNPTEADTNGTGKSLKNVRKKNRYFAVLKHGNLFLYKDDDCKNVQHVIVLKNSMVTMWPRTLREGELFSKRTAICIMQKEISKENPKRPATVDVLTGNVPDPDSPPRDSFFIYSDYNHEKEDWYLNLIKATKRTYLRKDNDEDKLEPSIYAKTAFFKTKNMMDLIQTLNSSEGQLTTKWLNALIGRLFLGLHNTKEFHDLVKARVEKKLMKIKKPGFLDDFQIQKINVGNSAPFLTFPKLLNLSPEGDLEIQVNTLYQGGLSIEISTKANINLGSHFKTKEVSLVLTVTLKKLAGQLLLKLKPPPSNRIWYGFTSMPEIDLDVEPVVSARQLTYGVVTKMIVNKFKELIRESLVVPYMDEFPIYNTEGEMFRGGIWDKHERMTRKRRANMANGDDATGGVDVEQEEEDEEDDESGVEEYLKSERADIQPISHDPKNNLHVPTTKKTGSFSSNWSSSSRYNNSSRFPDLSLVGSPVSHDSVSINSYTISHPPEIVPKDEIPLAVDMNQPVTTLANVYTDETAYQETDVNGNDEDLLRKMDPDDTNESSITSSSSHSRELFPETKQNISLSMKKLGKWYTKVTTDGNSNKNVETVPDELSQREKHHHHHQQHKPPPEMIKFRRERSVTNNSLLSNSPQQDQSQSQQYQFLAPTQEEIRAASVMFKKESPASTPRTPTSNFTPMDGLKHSRKPPPPPPTRSQSTQESIPPITTTTTTTTSAISIAADPSLPSSSQPPIPPMRDATPPLLPQPPRDAHVSHYAKHPPVVPMRSGPPPSLPPRDNTTSLVSRLSKMVLQHNEMQEHRIDDDDDDGDDNGDDRD